MRGPGAPTHPRDAFHAPFIAMDRLLARIRIVHRPLLIVVALLLPLAGLFYYMLAGYAENLGFAQSELRGNTYQRPLEKLLEWIPVHRRLAREAVVKRDANRAARRKVADQISQIFTELGTVDQAIGRDLEFTSEGLRKRQRESVQFTRFQQSWTSLAQASETLPVAEIEARHDALLRDVRTAIVHVGDTSKLILDPDLDSFYLMDATLVALPSTQDRVARITDFAVDAGGAKELTAEQRSQFAVHAAQLREADVARVTDGLQTSFNEDAAFYGPSPTLRSQLEKPLKDFRGAADAFLGVLDRQATNATEITSAAEFEEKGEALRHASFALWHTAVQELDTLLSIRRADYLHRRNQACAIVGLLLVVAGFVFWQVVRSITQPLTALTLATTKLGQGELALAIPGVERLDETGELARGVASMTEHLRSLLGSVSEGIQTLANSSSELSAVSSQTATGVKAVSDRASSVAHTAETSSTQTITIAASLEQTTHRLANVAVQAEEMTATVAKIASNSGQARTVTTEAREQTQELSAAMQALGASADEIGKVSETIKQIASQTNLLALNATIEAARAGAAGKGFAVVANEIKELASQAANATEEIKTKVTAIQSTTATAVRDVHKISHVVDDVKGLVEDIANSIDEQATVTRELSSHVAEVSAGLKTERDRITETASVSRTMAEQIQTVSLSAKDIRAGGEQVLQRAGELAQLADRLAGLVRRFDHPIADHSPRSARR